MFIYSMVCELYFGQTSGIYVPSSFLFGSLKRYLKVCNCIVPRSGEIGPVSHKSAAEFLFLGCIIEFLVVGLPKDEIDLIAVENSHPGWPGLRCGSINIVLGPFYGTVATCDRFFSTFTD